MASALSTTTLKLPIVRESRKMATDSVLLAGVFDPLLRALPAGFGGLGGVAAFDPTKLAPLYAPPALVADMGMRLLAVFAFICAVFTRYFCMYVVNV